MSASDVTNEQVLRAATRIANWYGEPCNYLPPCGMNDENCICLSHAKLALRVDREITHEIKGYLKRRR